jgi:lysophospholipase L1-like esterase
MSADIIARDTAERARQQGAANAAALAQSALSGFTPSNMAAWNRAKARVLAGVSDAVVAFVGDSTTVGHGAGDNPTVNMTNARFRAMPARVSARLNTLGLPASAEAVFGSNGIDTTSQLTNLLLYNPQLAISTSGTTNWRVTQIFSVAGHIVTNVSGTGAYALTPAAAFDSYDIYWVNAAANGAMTTDIGGATLATLTGSGGAVTVGKTSVSTNAPAATGTIIVKRVTGANPTYLLGIIPRNSGARRVQVLNLGWEGSQTGDWASTASATLTPTSNAAYNPANMLVTLAPDLTIIKLGANDLSHSTPVATSRANLQIVINAAKAGGGSVVLVTPTPQNPATRDPAGLTAAYNAMLAELAAANGCGLIDLYSRYVGWSAANGFGYFADDVHSLPLGYANEGDVIARALSGS